MVRPALSASRGIDIIDFLARFPGRGFTLSEIVKGTGINLSSCHAVLNALAERGYVARDPGAKAWRLGPVLFAMGQVALASQPLLAATRAAAEQLRAETGLPTLASTVIGEEIVGIVASDMPDGRSAGLNVGERMPLVPPVGASFLAWASDEEITAWLMRAAPGSGEAMLAYWRDGLARIRARSFQVELRAPGGPQMAERMTEMAAGRGAVRYKGELLKLVQGLGRHPEQPEVLAANESYDVILIAAPVFDLEGRCAYSLCLGGFDRPLPGDEVQALGGKLVAACLQVMQADRARRA